MLLSHFILFRRRIEEEAAAAERAKAEEEQRQREASQNPNNAQRLQEQQVRQALNQQTLAQFQSYAQSQFPGDDAQVFWYLTPCCHNSIGYLGV